MENQNYVLFAGINGAGKSTLYETFKKDFPVLSLASKRVNPDEILREFGGSTENRADQAKSAKLALQNIKKYITNGISFNQETTLAGNVTTHLNRLKKLKEHGYELTLYYVALNSPDLALDRIQERVAKGGHNIPEVLVRKRYLQTFENLKSVLPFFDNVDIFENSDKEFTRVFKKSQCVVKLDLLDNYNYLMFIRAFLEII